MNEKTPENKNQTDNAVGINPIWVVLVVAIVLLIIVGFYCYNFNSHIIEDGNWWNVFYNRSQVNGNWGTFGDYVGGILNPVIALAALYLIAHTYKLQKKEFEKIKNSTESQIKLAAITALLNTNYTKLNLLERDYLELLERVNRSYTQERYDDLIRSAVQNKPKKPSYLELKADEVKNTITVLKEKIVLFEKKLEDC